ncbi:GyrI-like domain-containing protein [Actinoplanes teichomyceticus]|uniref:Putative transcriptional regulator YdeE n=1 Tax=Actinoplanes teichomyceticus TaxID=1867 RepID=A0A561VL49_ACTTI|nr:effector binding domain-containing protein [Actinoplanes teichomyceticus]TWG12349.1 putative transcriptional regulator YdeE [Actinoplanes teichomyceticus]GIF13707.1 DNA-binding protein [Actinoplanes teichomyceticus]
MTPVDRAEVLVAGYALRTTTNAAEADPATAGLPGLWRRALDPDAFTRVTGRLDDRMYAVLTDYESDHRGAYTQVVGVAVGDPGGAGGLTVVRVPAARCLLRTVRGPMPRALITAWQDIWRHTDAGAEPARAFTTDLEVHHAGGADIYLAVH